MIGFILRHSAGVMLNPKEALEIKAGLEGLLEIEGAIPFELKQTLHEFLKAHIEVHDLEET